MPINNKNKKPIAQEIGRTSPKQYAESGQLFSTAEFDKELKGKKSIKVYNQMRLGDGTVQAIIYALKLPILSTRWYIEAASDSRQDTQIALDMENDILNGMSTTWTDFLNEALNYPIFGRYLFEQVYKFDDEGKVHLKKLAARLPETIDAWKTQDGEDGVTQSIGTDRVSIPMWKLLILSHNKEGDNWEGISILRGAYKHWYAKHALYKIDGIKAERQGLGVPFGETPPNANEEDKDALEKVLKNMRASEKGYVMYPSSFKVGFLDTNASSTLNLMPSILHHDRQISKAILAQFIELGTATGSYALSQDQTDLFLLALESVATKIKDAINEYVIKRLVDFNYNNVEAYPKLCSEKIAPVDFSKLMTAVGAGVANGLLEPDEDLEEFLRDVGDLPAKAEYVSVDPNMADDLFEQLETEMNATTGEMQFTPNDEPTPEDLEAAESEIKVILGAPQGPLSDEWKKKISEALKRKYGNKSTTSKGKKAKNPEVMKRQEEIKQLRNKIADFRSKTQEKLLELQAKGKKLDKKETAKMRLEMVRQKNEISKKIAKLKGEIDSLKADETKIESLIGTIERINTILDEQDNQ